LLSVNANGEIEERDDGMSKAPKTIKPKERDTIIQALSAGVVPRETSGE
jgi:hypothetical protein